MATNIYARLRAGIMTASPEEMRTVAAELAAALPADTALALHGDLGVGKTTFVQGLARGLGVTAQVTSPTFAIYTVYRAGARTLVHLDAYRLDTQKQVDALLAEEFLVSPWTLAVEWPEKIEGWLPPGAEHLTLSIREGEKHHLLLK